MGLKDHLTNVAMLTNSLGGLQLGIPKEKISARFVSAIWGAGAVKAAELPQLLHLY